MIFKYRGSPKGAFRYTECRSITVIKAAPEMDEVTEGTWSKERPENPFMLMADVERDNENSERIIFYNGYLMENGKTIDRFDYSNISDTEY